MLKSFDVEISSSDESVEDYNFTERVIDSKKSDIHSVQSNDATKLDPLPSVSLPAPTVSSKEPKKKRRSLKCPSQLHFSLPSTATQKYREENAASGLRNGARNY